MNKARDFINIRAAAIKAGDFMLALSMTAELERLGYQEIPEPEALETAVALMPERATPRKGRPPRPRCEHGKIVGRCVECDDGDLAA